MWADKQSVSVVGRTDAGMFCGAGERGCFGGGNRIKQRTPRDRLICWLGPQSKLSRIQQTHITVVMLTHSQGQLN